MPRARTATVGYIPHDGEASARPNGEDEPPHIEVVGIETGGHAQDIHMLPQYVMEAAEAFAAAIESAAEEAKYDARRDGE
jgi:hypothetical protein